MLGLTDILLAAAVVSALFIWFSPWCRLPGNLTEGEINRVLSKFHHLNGKMLILELLLAFGLVLPLSYGWYLLEQFLLVPRSIGAIHVISNTMKSYAVQSLFFSFMLGTLVAFVFLYLRHGRQLGTYREFRLWGLLRERYNVKGDYTGQGDALAGAKRWSRIMMVLTALMVFGYLFTCFICLDCYTIATQDRLVTNSLVEFREHEYTYDQVERILYVDRIKLRSGEIALEQSPDYAIFFNDGHVTRTTYWAMGIDFTSIVNTVGYISLKSGVPIERGIGNIDV